MLHPRVPAAAGARGFFVRPAAQSSPGNNAFVVRRYSA